MDDTDDEDEDTSLAGVPVPNTTIMTNSDDNSDAESNHHSIDPNDADDNSSKASVHSTTSHIPILYTTSEPPQHPPDEEEPDDIELPELETQVPVLHHSERVAVPSSDYIPWMGAKHMSQMYKMKPIKMKRMV